MSDMVGNPEDRLSQVAAQLCRFLVVASVLLFITVRYEFSDEAR